MNHAHIFFVIWIIYQKQIVYITAPLASYFRHMYHTRQLHIQPHAPHLAVPLSERQHSIISYHVAHYVISTGLVLSCITIQVALYHSKAKSHYGNRISTILFVHHDIGSSVLHYQALYIC